MNALHIAEKQRYKDLQNTAWFLRLNPKFHSKIISKKKSWKKYQSSFVFVSDCMISFTMYHFQKACYFLNGKCSLHLHAENELTLKKFKYSGARLFTVKQKKSHFQDLTLETL